MFVLNVDLAVKPGSEPGLETTYRDVFRPAISSQHGFLSVELLRSNKDGDNYRLSLAFDSRASQQVWVRTDLHRQVWPQMEIHCSGYSVNEYEAVRVD